MLFAVIFAWSFNALADRPDVSGNLTSSVQSVQQGQTVKGHVVDENGEPLIGVTVKNGMKVLAVTDIDGNFTASVGRNAQLVLSYTGYKDVKIMVVAQLQCSQTYSDLTM